MGKNIVFCADGTWNGPAASGQTEEVVNATNVFKLFFDLDGKDSPDSVRLKDEQERVLLDAGGAVAQASKYIHGVGDSDNPLVKLLGGTVGAGLIARILRGYTFISRNYAAQDRIYIVGFSRGAYTARALAGLIVSKGLLDATQYDLSQKEAAYKLAAAVWYDYRKNVLAQNEGLLARLEGIAADLPGFFSFHPTERLVAAQIEAVGVWDTVGSLGIPEYAAPDGGQLDTFKFAGTALSPDVKYGFHAVSVDEQRADFEPTLWDSRDNIEQALFPGAHADVGGGYPLSNQESDLSDSALNWMKGKLAAQGVAFSATPAAVNPNPLGTAHAPWLSAPWNILPRIHRKIPPGLKLHQSVVQRFAAGPVVPDPAQLRTPYRPANLSAYIDATGGVLPGVSVEA